MSVQKYLHISWKKKVTNNDVLAKMKTKPMLMEIKTFL